MNEISARVILGTAAGLYELGPEARPEVGPLAATEITALAISGGDTWVIAEGRRLLRGGEGGAWEEVARIEGPPGTCLARAPDGMLVGTERTHLLRFDGRRLAAVEPFEHAEGRAQWYTPWGDPADVRSIAVAAGGTIYVNVHVGGVLRSVDGGASWRPTLDIEADVHQVACHPSDAHRVFVAAAVGLGRSDDGGDSWRFDTDGLHAPYSRAVAVTADTLFLTASSGPGGRRSAVYRRPLVPPGPFERAFVGLPRWFSDNVDTGCLAAAGRVVVFGTEDGRVFLSGDGGEHWDLLAKDLPAVRAVALG